MNEYKIIASKTYATRANAEKAVTRSFGKRTDMDNVQYSIVCNDEGRFFPVFFGLASIQAGTHFHFNTIAF